METTEKKTTTKPKSTTRKTTTKSKPKTTNEVQPTTQPNATDLLATLTPEMIAQLVSLVQGQNEAKTVCVEEKPQPKRLNKAYLNSIRDEEVEVRNLTNGMVAFTSQKSGMTYKWMGKDEVELMTIGEVMTMHSQSEKFLKTPWLIVDNEDVMVSLGLSEIKQQVEDFEDLDEVLELPPHKIKEKLLQLSPSFQSQVSEMIGTKVLNGELRDIYVIRELEEFFGRKYLI